MTESICTNLPIELFGTDRLVQNDTVNSGSELNKSSRVQNKNGKRGLRLDVFYAPRIKFTAVKAPPPSAARTIERTSSKKSSS